MTNGAATISFNTLRFANRLKAAGIPPEHAEAEAEALTEVFEANISGLATKQDMKSMETRFEAKFDVLRADMSGIKSELTTLKWVLGFLATGVFSLLIKGFLSS